MGNGKEVITVALQFDYESELDKLSNNLNKILNKSGSEMTDKMRDGIKSLQSQIKELKTSVESLRNAPSGASEYGKVIEGLQTQFKQLSNQVISLEKQFRDMGSSVAQSSEVKEITNTIGALDEAVKKTTSSVHSMTNSVNKTDGSTLKSELKETKQAAEETAKALDELSNKTTVYKNQTNTTTQRKGKTIKTLGWTEFTDFFQTVTKNAVIKNDGSLSITSEKVRTNYEALEKEITKIDSKIVQLQFDMGTQGEVARASTQRQLVMLREYLDLLEKTRNKQIGSPAYLPDSGHAQVIDTVRSQTLISKYNEQITKVSNNVDKLLDKVHELQKTPGISSDYADDLNKADGILKNLSTDLESLFNKIKAGNGSISDQDILQFFDSYSKGIISVEDILGFDKLSKKLDTTYQKIAKLRIELNTADPTSRSFIQQQISELEDFTQQIKLTQVAFSTTAGVNASEMTNQAALTQYSKSLKKVQDHLVKLIDKIHELQKAPGISSDYADDLDNADKKIQNLQISIQTLWASIQRGQADENSIKAFFDTYGDALDSIQKTIDFSKADKQLADLKNELIEINSELAKTTKFEDKNALEKKKEAIEEVIKALTKERNLELGLSETAAKTYNNSKASISQYNEEVIKTNDSLNKMREKIASLISDSSRSTSFKKELGFLDDEISSFQSNLVNAFNVLESDPFNTTSINTFYDQLKNVVGILEKYNSTISNSTSSTAYSATREEVQKLDNRISAFLDQNSAAANRFKQQLLGIQSVLKDTLSNNGELTKLDLSSYSEQVNKIESEVKSLHQTGNSFFTSLRKQLQSANAQFIGTFFSIQDFIRYAKEIFDVVTEIDSALTELRKVSDATSARLVESFEASAEAARDLGASVKDVINETADWARLGYSVDEAEELARVTTLFKNVGDNMSAETASEYMISALQGFQMAADDAEHIVDAYNEVANNFAIDTAGIGEALERSASSFTAANTSMEKAIALVTATNEVIQNPESVGTLWKTMSARLRGATTELAELGEEEDEFTQTTSKLRDLVMGLTGFDIMIDEDNFKDIYDIILGIGEKWDELTDIEQASLGEALAGKRNANAFYAVIGNLDTLQKAYESASNSAGSAAKEQENYAQSIQYSLNKLSASFEVLAADILDSNFAKNLVEFLNSVVNLLDTIIENVGILVPLLTTLGGLSIIKNIDNIKALSDLGKTLAATEKASKVVDTLESAGATAKEVSRALSSLTAEQAANILATKGLNKERIKEILINMNVEEQIAEETAKRVLLTNTTIAQGKSTFSLSAAYKGLAQSLNLSTAALTKLLGATAIIGALVVSVYELSKAQDEIIESAREIGQEFANTRSDIEGYKKDIEGLLETVNNSSDLDEVREAREQLYNIQKQMIDAYGNEAGKVIDLTNTLNDQTDAWNNLIKAQWQATKTSFNSDKGFWNNAYLILNGYESNIEAAIDKYENLNTVTLELSSFDSDFAELIADKYGGKYSSYAWTSYVELSGTLEEIEQQLIDIQKLAEKTEGLEAKTISEIASEAESVSSSIKGNEEFYKQFVYFERILNNNAYEKYLEDVLTAYKEYEDAYINGDVEAQKAAILEIAKFRQNTYAEMLKDDDLISVEEQSVLDYVNDLIPQIQDELSAADFQIDIEANTNSMTDRLTEALSQFEDLEHIQSEFTFFMKRDQADAWHLLTSYAKKYNLTLQGLVDLLAKLGIIEVDYNFNIPQDLRKEVDKVNNRLSMSEEDSQAIDDFFEEMQIDTEEEYQLWLDVASGCTRATEAMQKYRDAVAEVSDEDPFSYNSLTDAISDIDKKLVPQFKKLGELYDEIFNGDNGFDLSGVGDDLSGIVDVFTNIDEALEIDPPTEEVDKFLSVIGNADSTEKQVHDAFDGIATAYFNAAVEAGNFSEKNAAVLEQMLTEMGIANASEVVDYYEQVAVAKKLAADNGKDLANMTAAEIEQFAQEVGASEETANVLYILALKKIFLNENWINEETSIEQVLGLASAAGVAADAVERLLNIQSRIGDAQKIISDLSGKTTLTPIEKDQLDGAYQTIDQLEKDATAAAQEIQDAVNNFDPVDVEFSIPKTGSGGSAASEAGKDAAEEYVKAFEEELKDLERLRDAGVISEKEFLERYKELIEKYFKDVDGYADEYADRMKDYFDRLTTYYENIFSAISTVLSHRINALQDAKSAAVDAINAEKDAAAESYQTQIDYLDELIDAKEAEIDAIDDEIDRYQDQIDAIDKQIDALEEANQKRQQAINLQKAQYELEKAQNQRTKLIYKDGQLVYENDTSAVRDARENLEDAEFEIQKQKLEDLKKPLEEQIELLEKRKELIQDEIDGYQKQQDALQKALEASNKYYDSLIKETEAYWDSLIEKLENTKSKFEEIAQLKELSEALALIKDFYGETEYTLEDVWNGVPGAIDYVLEKYKDALMGANSYNEEFAQALALAEQEITGSLGNISSSASDIESALGPVTSALVPIGDEAPNIESAATALGEAADNTAELATNSSTASSNTQSLATNLEEVASRSGDVAANTGDSATNIETIGTKAGEANPKVEQLANANGKLADNAGNVAENVGKAAEAISDEGTNAESAYTSLNNIANLNLATIVTQTKNLAEALSDVASALGLSEDATVSALETTITQLSQMSLGDEQTGIIGSFNALQAAVTGVTDAIGGGSGGGTSGGDGTTDKSQSMSADAEDGGSSGLIQAIADLHKAADTHIGKGSGEEGEEGGTVISDFDALKASVDLVAEAIGIAGENGEVSEESLLGVIQAMPKAAEEPITNVINFFKALERAIGECISAVRTLADEIKSLGDSAGSIGFVKAKEATGNVHVGNAYASGKLGLKKSETALVGEVGRELVYNPKSGTYRTVGDNGPEITRLQKGDLIFNAEQTKAIIKNGKRDHGRSYADGNAIMPLTSEEMELFKKIGGAVTDIQADVGQMLDPVKAMAQKVTTNNTTNIAPVINITGTSFSVSGVTGEDVTRQISDVFEGMISNAYQRAMKK